MKRLLVSSAIAVCVIFLSVNAYPQGRPPASFIDKGACPFECCTYGEWQTKKTTAAFARPDVHSKRVGQFVAGTKVIALTGETHAAAGRFVVKKPYEKYRPGDTIRVYTYGGEGSFKIWFKGKMEEENLGFSPYGGDTGKRCEAAAQCWGELDKELQRVWWIKIKSPDGWVGWTNQGEHFSGADRCG